MTQTTGFEADHVQGLPLEAGSHPAVIAETLGEGEGGGPGALCARLIYMKSEAEVDRAFAYARVAGMPMIIGVPNYELLDYTQPKVQEYDIRWPYTTTAGQVACITLVSALRRGVHERWVSALVVYGHTDVVLLDLPVGIVRSS